jgi:glycosyltransferase involved in cell wall biosynthesis
MMKTLLLSDSDIDGGAARAAYRLHQGLKAVGVDSQMLVRAKFSDDRTVLTQKTLRAKLAPALNGCPLRFYSKRDRTMFSSQWFPDTIASEIARLDPTIINMHWVCNGFLQIETVAKFNKPLIWTLQDMWAFTGGCHYTQSCTRYTESCGACPQLKSDKELDLSRWIWQRKAKAWNNLNLTIVAPSSWMAQCVTSSSLFRDLRVEIIPFGLDTKRYQPANRQMSREMLNLPLDKQLILFGALAATKDHRKGFHLLLPALQSLSQSGWQDRIELVVFGSSEPENPIDLGFKSHYLGHFNDDISLTMVYSASDVMIVPSIQEAFGQTASESLACGTPVIAFKGTGVEDIVEHQQNGYLATSFDPDDLVRGMTWILEDSDRYMKLRASAREKAEKEYSLDLQAQRYLSLFEEIGAR